MTEYFAQTGPYTVSHAPQYTSKTRPQRPALITMDSICNKLSVLFSPLILRTHHLHPHLLKSLSNLATVSKWVELSLAKSLISEYYQGFV